jgi:predicted ABC-type ATPase
LPAPIGAGKTTFAKSFLVKDVNVVRFLNVDFIAAGLSPLKPELASRQAGRILLKELVHLTESGESFALESTLSGKTYISLIRRLKRKGYFVLIIFLQLDSPELAVQRVAMRVAQGGHNVPKADIRRRFDRGLKNFVEHYQALADHWMRYDASGRLPVLLSESNS